MLIERCSMMRVKIIVFLILVSIVVVYFCIARKETIGFCRDCGAVVAKESFILFGFLDLPKDITIGQANVKVNDTGLSLFLGRCPTCNHIAMYHLREEGLFGDARCSGSGSGHRLLMLVGPNKKKIYEFLKLMQKPYPGLKDSIKRILKGNEDEEDKRLREMLRTKWDEFKAGAEDAQAQVPEGSKD